MVAELMSGNTRSRAVRTQCRTPGFEARYFLPLGAFALHRLTTGPYLVDTIRGKMYNICFHRSLQVIHGALGNSHVVLSFAKGRLFELRLADSYILGLLGIVFSYKYSIAMQNLAAPG